MSPDTLSFSSLRYASIDDTDYSTDSGRQQRAAAGSSRQQQAVAGSRQQAVAGSSGQQQAAAGSSRQQQAAGSRQQQQAAAGSSRLSPHFNRHLSSSSRERCFFLNIIILKLMKSLIQPSTKKKFIR